MGKCFNLLLQQPEHLGNQIPIGNGVIHANAYRHYKPALFLPISAPIHDGGKEQITVRQFNMQRII